MKTKDNILNEAKRIEEDSIHSAKGHFYSGQCWAKANLWLGSISALLAAIAGVSALTVFDYHNIIAGILSIIIAGLAAVITFINPNERGSLHQRAGNKYNALKNDTRIFYSIDIEESDSNILINDLKKLNERRNKLNSDSPQISKWAYERAKKGIEEGEAEYKITI